MASLVALFWLQLQLGWRAPPAKPAPPALSPADEELLQDIDFIHFLQLKDNADWLLP